MADTAGNYAMATAVALLPIMGGLALAVDYTELNRQQEAMLNALDAAGIATAREVAAGTGEAELIAYARAFFDANLGPVDPARVDLQVTLPTDLSGGGTVRLAATLDFQPYFFPAFKSVLTNGAERGGEIALAASSEVRLKNTLEVSLVLDNSGSMAYLGHGSGEPRLDLLKDAAAQLVDTIAAQAEGVQQVDKPVQFALVPFAAAVNVGPGNDDAPWMDTLGLSPVHHENFDWASLTDPDRTAEKVAGVWRKKGTGWGLAEGEMLSRFSLYRDMQRVESREWVSTGREWVCTRYRDNGSCREGRWQDTGYWEETVGTYASWQGCVEARPYPYNTTNDPAHATQFGEGDPASLFVPMFAPDETDQRDGNNRASYNNWWQDHSTSGAAVRMANASKYFEVRPYGLSSPQGTGPNQGCTTTPITPLTDVAEEEGLEAVKAAIEAMRANGGTDVMEGLGWGWRTVASGAPFAGGRPESERGNDKVVIVLTDGESTYYTPSSLGSNDLAQRRSIYSAHGYLQPGYDGGTTGRLMLGTSAAVGKYDFSNANYTRAINEHFAALCENAKAGGVILMTVALDLNSSNAGQATAIDLLRDCSSESRFRRDPDDPTRGAKLFWNATGASLSDDFKEIADELSNLRIVS